MSKELSSEEVEARDAAFLEYDDVCRLKDVRICVNSRDFFKGFDAGVQFARGQPPQRIGPGMEKMFEGYVKAQQEALRQMSRRP